jgi:hypothetical protein
VNGTKAVFISYLVLIVVGLMYFVALGLAHQ